MKRSLEAASGVLLLVATYGCDGGLFPILFSGTYEADVPCTLTAMISEGAEEELDFEQPIRLRLERDGTVWINNVEIVVGAEVVRSIPTADLAFEVVAVERSEEGITIAYEPRPSLTGISAEGELVENYNWGLAGGAIPATAIAELTLTDVEQTVTFVIGCQGSLFRVGSQN